MPNDESIQPFHNFHADSRGTGVGSGWTRKRPESRCEAALCKLALFQTPVRFRLSVAKIFVVV